jgi:2-methylcitrate dehydratase PrpD
MPSHYKFWHTTGTVGAFGAAAAVATVLGCNRDQIAHALGTVGSFAAGLQQAFRSQCMTKPLHGGHAAEVGALAAMGAAKGLTGALDMLEGEVGFGAAMSVNPDWTKAIKDLGVDYHITRVTFKNHGCCGHTFAPIDGALHLQKTHGFGWRDIKRVTIATYKAGTDITDNPNPEGEYQAKFSLQYVTAHALVHGSVRLVAFAPERLLDPDVRAVLAKVEVVTDPVLSKGYPGQRAAHVEIELNDGRVFKHFQPYRKGDPEMLLTDDEVNEKFLELAMPVIGDAPARELLATLWALDQRSNTLFEFAARPRARAAG